MHIRSYVLGGLLVTGVGAGLPACSGTDREVQAVYQEYRRALAAGDLAALRRTLAAEKVASLDAPDAAQILDLVRSLAPEAPTPGAVTRSGETATLALTAVWEGQEVAGTVDLRREGGTWRIVEEHWSMTLSLGGGSGDFAGRLLADRAARPVKQRSWKGHEGAVTRVVFLAHGEGLASIGYDDYRLCLWDPADGSLRDERVLESRPTDLAAHPTGGVVVGDVSGALTVVPMGFPGWGEPRRLISRVGGVTRLALSRDGRWAATSTFQEPARIWDLEQGTIEQELDGPVSLRGISFAPAGNLLAAGGYGNSYFTWKLRDDKRFGGRKERKIPKVDAHSDVLSVAVSPDGKAILTGHMDSSITLWDAEKGKQVHNTFVPEASTWDVAWCPDGTLFASAQQDGCVYLWDRETATPLAKLRSHEGAARTVAFDPLEWEHFASGGEDGELALWR